MKLKKSLKLIIALALPLLAGFVGSLFTTPAVASWYPMIAKPALNPPNWIFGPVWTLLYILMGLAAFFVWNKGKKKRDVRLALGIFVFQLILNFFWSIIFFGAHNPGVAFLELLSLWCAVLALALAFREVSRPAFYLILPYLLWVSFAGYLNYSIWQLSGGTMNSVSGAIQVTTSVPENIMISGQAG
jgi:tryptophan-rich sensory protein